MPRSRPEACIFCGDTPCSCNKKASAAPSPRKRAVPQAPPQGGAPEVPTVTTAAQAAMKAKAADAQPTFSEQRFLDQAIRNLRELLAPEERQRFAEILSPADDRVKSWKESHA